MRWRVPRATLDIAPRRQGSMDEAFAACGALQINQAIVAWALACGLRGD